MISHLLKFSRYFENERADREIVTLKSYGWSSREIGKIKNMPSSTVRNRLAVLKSKLKRSSASLADVESTIIHIRLKSCRAICPTALLYRDVY